MDRTTYRSPKHLTETKMSAKQTFSLRHLLLSGLILSLFVLAVSDDALLALLRYGRVFAAETTTSADSSISPASYEKSTDHLPASSDTSSTTLTATASSPAPDESSTETATRLATTAPATKPVSDSSPDTSVSSVSDTSTPSSDPVPATDSSLFATVPDKSVSTDSDNTASATNTAAPGNDEEQEAATTGARDISATSSDSEEARTDSANPVDPTAETEEAFDKSVYSGLNLDLQPGEKITEDRKLCTKELPVRPDSEVIFKMEGLAGKSIVAYEPTPLKYCYNLVLGDFDSGSYKLTVEAQIGGKVFHLINSIEIDRSTSQDALAQKAAELENRCSQDGADSSEECKQFYLDKYGEKINCQDMESEECDTAVKDTYIGEIVQAEKAYARIGEQAEDILGKSMTAGKLENLINQSNGKKVLDFSTPLVTKKTQIRIIPSYESVVLGKYDGLRLTAPIVIVIDSDGDGVSDDIEKRLGTEPDARDTDGDGYTDGEELIHGYDPLGEGKRDVGLSPAEKILIEGRAIGQPTGSGETSTDLTVREVKIVYGEDGSGDSYVLTGKAAPDTIFTLYVYSDVPVVATVKTDASGNWEYHFENTLEYGNHEVYIATNDDTGKVVTKSSPLSFLIEEAQAATAAEDGSAADSGHDSDNMVNYYIYAAGALIILGIIIFLLTLSKSRNKAEK